MSTYRGPATVITSNGAEIPVHASLRSSQDGQRGDWHGTLTIAPQHFAAVANETANTPHGVLQLESGIEASYVAPDGVGTPTGSPVTFRIEGAGGSIPF